MTQEKPSVIAGAPLWLAGFEVASPCNRGRRGREQQKPRVQSGVEISLSKLGAAPSRSRPFRLRNALAQARLSFGKRTDLGRSWSRRGQCGCRDAPARRP